MFSALKISPLSLETYKNNPIQKTHLAPSSHFTCSADVHFATKVWPRSKVMQRDYLRGISKPWWPLLTAFPQMRSGLQQNFRPGLLYFPLLGGCIENCLAKQTSARESLGILITAFWLSVLDKHFCRLSVPWHSCAAYFQSGGRCEWE